MNIVNSIQSIDDAALHAMNACMGRWPAFDKLLQLLLTADLFKFGALMAVYCGLWFHRGGEQPLRREKLLLGVIASTVGMFATRFLTLALPFRERPFVRLDLAFVLPPYYQPEFRNWSAFPSDHASMAFALCAGLWLVSRRLGLLAAAYSLLMICLPRVYFGLHHPSDVAAGALVGFVSLWLCHRSRRIKPLTSTVMQLEARHSGLFYSVSFVAAYQITILFSGLRGFAVSAFNLLQQMVG